MSAAADAVPFAILHRSYPMRRAGARNAPNLSGGEAMHGYLECLKNYANFSGRTSRRDYWMFVLVNTIVLFALTMIEAVARAGVAESNSSSVLAGLYNLAVLLPSLAAPVRRMHDTDRRGWWLFVPIVSLVFACMDGEHGDNRFGPDPKATSTSVDPSRWAAA